jgi:hypothetical protein
MLSDGVAHEWEVHGSPVGVCIAQALSHLAQFGDLQGEVSASSDQSSQRVLSLFDSAPRFVHPRKGAGQSFLVHLFQSSMPLAPMPIEATGSMTRKLTTAAHRTSSSFCFLFIRPS